MAGGPKMSKGTACQGWYLFSYLMHQLIGQIYNVFRHMSQKKFFFVFHLLSVAQETFLQFNNAVIQSEPEDYGRDPESRDLAEYQIILDLPPPPKITGTRYSAHCNHRN
jgi:hypothetical protein